MATPYMNLILPVVGPLGTTGPEWANLVNAALSQLDAHDHSTGNGKQITPAGININQTLQMNSQQISEIASLALDNLVSQPADSNLIYEFAGELYFNDSSGNKVQLTSGGTINVASLGTITGDYSTSTADLTYSDASKTFIFKQSATLTANVDCGPIKIYRNVASSPYARIQQSNSQVANLDWTLPAAYPASKLPLKADASGVQTIEQIVTADIADSQVTAGKLATDAVETAKIKDLNVTTGKLANNAVTQAKRAALGQQVSSSSGTFSSSSATQVDVTNLSVTITTTGRPVFIGLISDGTANPSSLVARNSTSGDLADASYYLWRGGSQISQYRLYSASVTSSSLVELSIPSCSLWHIDVPAAGTYTYKLRTSAGTNTTSYVSYTEIIAYEL